jgi:hypothetical protein
MGAAVAERVMTNEKGGRPKKPGGEGSLVRIAPDLVTKARYLAADRGVPMSDLLSEILRPALEQMFREAGRGLFEEGGSGGDAPRKGKRKP